MRFYVSKIFELSSRNRPHFMQKVYTGETGRDYATDIANILRDIEINDKIKMRPNQLLTILINTWQSVAFLCTMVTQKAAKVKSKNSSPKSIFLSKSIFLLLLIPTEEKKSILFD